MLSFWTQTLTVVHPERVEDPDGDVYGNETLDWGNAEERDVIGHVQPVAAPEEIASGRDAIVTRYRAWLPAGDPVTGYDRIVYDGQTYEVDGDPERWPSATGGLDHVSLLLVRVEG